MKLKLLIVLVVCTLGLYLVGTMLVILLPIYAVQLGMDEGIIGLYLGLAFSTLTIGALSSGWLSNRFQRRKLTIIVICLIAIPTTFMMGQVNNLVLLTFFTLIAWFAAGLASSMVSIINGIHAPADERGRIFGIMATTVALAQVIGGFSAGAIVDRWGFTGLFSLSAFIWLIPVLAALFIQDDVVIQANQAAENRPQSIPTPLSRALWMLILVNTLVAITRFSAGFVQPLMMNGLDFDASAISSATTISGLVTLPLPFLVGWLSDRIGRRQLLIGGYILTFIGAVLLISALDLWNFWLVSSFMTLAAGTAGVANAFVADMAPPEVLNTAMARFSATPWIAGIIGYGATGFIIQGLGPTVTLLLGATLPVFAIIIMLMNVPRDAPVAVR